jgi:hypothetical protein
MNDVSIVFQSKKTGVDFFMLYFTIWSAMQESKKFKLTPSEIRALAYIIVDNTNFYGDGRKRAARRLRTSYNAYSVLLHNLVKKGMLLRVKDGYSLATHIQDVVNSYSQNDVVNICFKVDTSID